MRTMKILALSLMSLFALQACDDDDDATPQTETISGLTCPNAVFASKATGGTAYTSTFTVPYTGGNGMAYTTGSAISSSGVTGLSATLASGTLANGGGNLTYNVSGTPSAGGSASFLINFGGQSCTVVMPVDSAMTNP